MTVIERARIIIGFVVLFAGCSANVQMEQAGSGHAGNWSGQLGLGDYQPRGDEPNEMGDNLPAVDLGGEKAATAIGMGHEHGCATLNDGALKCWGGNVSGALGRGDTQDRGDAPGEMGDSLPAVKLFSNLW